MDKNDKNNNVSGLSLEEFKKLNDDDKAKKFKLLSESDRGEAFSFLRGEKLRYELFDLLSEDEKLEHLMSSFSGDEIRGKLLEKMSPDSRIHGFQYLESDLVKFEYFNLLPDDDRLRAFGMFYDDKFKSMVFGLLRKDDMLGAFTEFESDKARYDCFAALPLDDKETCFDAFSLEQKILIYKNKLGLEERNYLMRHIVDAAENMENCGEINEDDTAIIWTFCANHLSPEDCLKRLQTGIDHAIYTSNFEYYMYDLICFLGNIDFCRRLFCFKYGIPENKQISVFRQLTRSDRIFFLSSLSKNDVLKAFEDVISPEERWFWFALLDLKDNDMIQAFKLVPEKDRKLAIKTLPYEKDELRKKLSDALNLENDDRIKPLSILKAKKIQESENKVPEVPECENNNKTAIFWLEEID